jgi:hypothetical protein
MSYANFTHRTQLSFREAVRGKDIPDLLYDLLQQGSPRHSEDKVEKIITHFLDRLPHKIIYNTDSVGNLIVTVGDGPHETMFSSHMDTVSAASGRITPVITTGDSQREGYIYGSTKNSNVYFHEVHTNRKIKVTDLKDFAKEIADSEHFSLKRNGTSAKGNEQFDFFVIENGKMVKRDGVLLTKVVGEPIYNPSGLGADDKVGCYIMCRLIKENVGGLYIFHVGEESGGVGSRHISTRSPEVVKGIKRAIAFDRRGHTDIITHQSGGKCASNEFASALADQINAHTPNMAPKFAPSSHGVYTDTAEYTGLIPECTNVSCGYNSEHTTNENFDLIWLEAIFIPALLSVNWSTLPTVRDVNDTSYSFHGGYGTYRGVGVHGHDFDNWYEKEFKDDISRYPQDKWKGMYPEDKTGSRPTNVAGTTSSPTSTGSTNVVQLSGTATGTNTHVTTRTAIANRDTNVVPLDEVTADTPLNKVPKWEPADGLIDGVSNVAMKRIITAFLVRECVTYDEMAVTLMEQLQENRYIIEENNNLEDELSAFRDRIGQK